LFGDDELVFVVPPEASTAEVFRALDGESLGSRPLAASPVRLDTVGRIAFLWQRTGGRHVFSAYDIMEEKAVWKRDFAEGALTAQIENDEAAVLEPDGRLTVMSLVDGAVSLQSAIDPPKNVQQIFVVRSRDHYVLIGNLRSDPNANGNVRQAIVGPIPPQSLQVSGIVHAFDRASRKRLWSQPITQQLFDPYQPADLPILTFAVTIAEVTGRNAGRPAANFHLMCLDKRTGRVAFSEVQQNEPQNFVDIVADIDQHQIELKLARSAVRLTFTDKAWPETP
jgi:hypothetical protein